MNSVWDSVFAQQLAAALTAIDDQSVMQNVLRDVMTEKEIAEVSARLQAAKMLQAGKTYNEVIAATKLSSRTVARISDWMQNGAGGYAAALQIINKSHHDHISPARAA